MKEIYLGMPVRIKEKGSPVKRLAVFGNLIAVAAQKARLLLSKIFQYYSIIFFLSKPQTNLNTRLGLTI